MGQETAAPSSQDRGPGARLWLKTLPAVFVFLWSTGFVAGKYGMPHTGPFTFLSIRYLIVIFLLTGVALLTRAPWPRRGG
jgi:drug/metabolite transporter (DMT)-like permease